MTIQEILDKSPIELFSKNLKETKELLRPLVSAANKRIDRLQRFYEETGFKSPTLSYIEKRGRYTSGLNTLSEARNELSQLRDFFLKYKTSSIKGFTEYIKDTQKRTGAAEPWELNDLWEIVDYIRKNYPVDAHNYGSTRLIAYVSGKVKGGISFLQALEMVIKEVTENQYTQDEFETIEVDEDDLWDL